MESTSSSFIFNLNSLIVNHYTAFRDWKFRVQSLSLTFDRVFEVQSLDPNGNFLMSAVILPNTYEDPNRKIS